MSLGLEREYARTKQLLSSPVSGEVLHPMDRGMLGAHCCSIRSIFILSTLPKRLVCVCVVHTIVVNSNCFLCLAVWSRNLVMSDILDCLIFWRKHVSALAENSANPERGGQTCGCFETKS